jgi:hypothetical protein
MGQLQELQSLGVTLTAWEQYTLAIERANNALSVGKVTAEQSQRAHQAAALNTGVAYAEAWSGIGHNLKAAFEDNKALAYASTIIDTAAAVMKSLAQYGYTPTGVAAAAAAAAAGVAQLAKISSTSVGGGGSVAPAVGGGAAVSAPAPPPTAQPPSQSLLISVAPGPYSYKDVEALIGAINNAVNNGVTLVATKRRWDVGGPRG